MKSTLFILLFTLSLTTTSGQNFQLKKINSNELGKEFAASNYEMNTLYTHLKRNYKIIREKYNVKYDEEMNNEECGFMAQFEPNITYTYLNCGEAKPVEEKISFPKVVKEALQYWIEQLHLTQLMGDHNIWYKGENEYGPKDEEAGCYYKIIPSKEQSIVEIWCGS